MAVSLGAQTVATANGTSVQATLNGVQAGDLLIACLVFRSPDSVSGVSVSDNVNGAYTLAQALLSASGGIYFFQASQAGDITVTCSWTETINAYLNFSRWAGARTTGGKDQSNQIANPSGTSHSHGSITTTGAGLIITASAQDAALTETVATGFTALSNNGGRDYFQYKIGTGAETTTGTYTTAETNTSRGAIANFLEAVMGGGALEVLVFESTIVEEST